MRCIYVFSMKNVLLFFVFIFNFCQVNAQEIFSLSELETLCTKSFNDFEIYVLNKKYYYVNEISTEIIKQYFSETARYNNKKDMVSLTQYPGAKPSSMFSTTNRQVYLNVMNQLSGKGYKFTKDVNSDTPMKNVTWHYYSDSHHTAIFYTYTGKDGIAWYCIQVY